MLSDQQLRHFSDHGWLLLNGAVSPDRCATYVSTINRLVEHWTVKEDRYRVVLDQILLMDESFVDWLRTPGVLGAVRQLMGAQPFLASAKASIGLPQAGHAEAKQDPSRPSTWGWHRGMRPKWTLVPRDDNPDLVQSAWINTITYLTAVDGNTGGTPVLDGSHKDDASWKGWHSSGDYEALITQYPLVRTEAGAGSVLLFSEALFHAVPPVLSEFPSYKLVFGFWPTWWNRTSRAAPTSYAQLVPDRQIRDVLDPEPLLGQGPLPYGEEAAALGQSR